MAVFAGIDLAALAKRPSAFAAVDAWGRLLDLGYARTEADILETTDRLSAALVAVDSPIGLPRGLCCLEESCPCAPTVSAKGRAAERVLARLGIPSYFTTKRSIIKAMVYRAMALREGLERRGRRVLEVYPYATKVRLFGRPIPRKTSPRGLTFLRQRLASLVPGAASRQEELDHDLCDALLAAYTAYLYVQRRTESLGVEEEGQITLPLAAL